MMRALVLALLVLPVGCREVDRPVARAAAKAIADLDAQGAAKPAAPPGMVWVAAGTYRMGDDQAGDDARPVHEVELDGFWLDAREVTNRDFARFVEATEYVTIAERKPDPAEFPDVDPADLVPGSLVFVSPPDDVGLGDATRWWEFRSGASWRHPEGPESSIDKRMDHPVVHVGWLDAVAYAKWARKRLPTEAEWEYAARGGLASARYVWGDDRVPGGTWPANIWQGQFPITNDLADGFAGTAPVGTFPANGYGLFDMSGNVWEWCADWYRPDYYAESPRRNPPGPSSSVDPDEPDMPKRVVRGGSFLCSDVYCKGYQPGNRMKSSPDTGLSNTGFRCAMSAQVWRERK